MCFYAYYATYALTQQHNTRTRCANNYTTYAIMLSSLYKKLFGPVTVAGLATENTHGAAQDGAAQADGAAPDGAVGTTTTTSATARNEWRSAGTNPSRQ